VLFVLNTSKRPIAEPMSVRGIGETRGKSVLGSEAIANAQVVKSKMMGHSAASTVEKRHVAVMRSHRRKGDLPVYCCHVS